MKRFLIKSDSGSVMLEYIAVLAAFLGLLGLAEFAAFGTLFNPFPSSDAEMEKTLQGAFVKHYEVVVKAIAQPFP